MVEDFKFGTALWAVLVNEAKNNDWSRMEPVILAMLQEPESEQLMAELVVLHPEMRQLLIDRGEISLTLRQAFVRLVQARKSKSN